MKTIEVPIYGITVTLDGESGSIHAAGLEDKGESPEYKAAIDGLLTTVLDHACAGINVDFPIYVEGIERALVSLAEKYGK